MTLKLGSPKPFSTERLIVITGPRGNGKTSLAATWKRPNELSKAVMMDTEKSNNRFRERLHAQGLEDFGLYIDLEDPAKRFGFKREEDLLDRIAKGLTPWISDKELGGMLDYYLYILKRCNEIPYGKYDTFIGDTWEKFEYGMRAWCEQNANKLRISKDHGKMEAGLVRPLYENFLNALWGRGIETIILNFHLKNVWANNRPVANKVAMAGNVVLYKRASLMLWLVTERSNPNGEPAALVIKERMMEVGTQPGEDGELDWSLKRMLPPRIPCATWKDIRRYLKDGYDNAHPAPGETPSQDEIDLISDMYNDKQMELMLKEMEVQEKVATAAMVEAGVMPMMPMGGEAKGFEKVEGGGAAIVPTDIPQTKSEAIEVWKKSGGRVPDLLRLLRDKEIGDSEIGTRWNEIVEAGNPTL